MIERIENALVTNAQRIGFLPVYSYFRRITTGSQIAIIMYHRVSLEEGNILVPSLAPELFDKQIRYLKENFRVISLDALPDLLKASGKLPEKTVAITFDDGYKDNFVHAFPILKKYAVCATIFLTTGCINTGRLFWWDVVDYCVKHSSAENRIVLQGIGTFKLNSKSDKIKAEMSIVNIMKKMTENKRKETLSELALNIGMTKLEEVGKDLILSWAEIKEMATNGITFGAHTVNHPILTNTPTEICRREIVQSKRDIEAALGTPVTSFSYPDGAHTSDITQMVKESGFTCATITHPYGLVSKGDNVFALRRIAAYTDFNLFKGMLSGIIGDLGSIAR